MSYDLFFRTEGARPSVEALREWFASRPHTTVERSTAVYRNEATGASFTFELADDGRPGVAPVSLVLGVLHPSWWVLEAASEVAALVRRFRLRVFDPQATSGEAPFAPEAFVRGWRAANVAAHRALARASGEVGLRTLPAATNTAVWAWNHAREAYLDRLGTIDMLPCVVPQVVLLAPEGDDRTVLTAVVWADGVPVALPEVDVVLAICPRSDHGRSRERPARAIPLVALRPWLERVPFRDADHSFGLGGTVYETGLPHWIVDTDAPPPGLLDALASLGSERRLERLAPEQVLDRETVDAVRALQRATPTPIARVE